MRSVLARRCLGALGATFCLCVAASAAMAQSLPSPWSSSDVGTPAMKGAAVMSFTIVAGGTDIWGTADQFQFMYQPMSGDGEVVARVASLVRTHNWAKAGVMIRESLAADSAHAMMTISANNGYAFQRRPSRGALSLNTSGGSGRPPGWVRLVRRGDLFEAYRSADGRTWTLVGSDTIPMADAVYVGIAVTSHSTTATTAVVDNVMATASSSANLPPAVTITAPANGAQVPASSAVTIQADASDPENRLASVEFYVDGTLLTADTTAPFEATWNASTPGTHSLTAVSKDADGGSTTSTAVSVTVNGAANQPPAVSLKSPVNGATYPAPASITLAADASDADGRVARVEFLSGTTVIGTATAAPYSYMWPNVAAGNYVIKAVAYDDAGASTASSSAAVTVQAANTPPTVTVTSPSPGATFTAPATIPLAATASDAEGAVARVEFQSGTSAIGTDTSAPFSFDWSNVPAGTYTLRAVAYDSAGASTASATVSVTVNPPNTPPSVTLTSPAAGATFTAPATIPLAATATDAQGAVARVEFLSGTSVIGSDTSAPFSFDWANVPAGTYSLSAVAYDSAGATASSAAVSVTVRPPNQPPVVAMTSPAPGATFMAPAAITLSATASDPDGTVARVEFFSGTVRVATVTAAPFSFNWANVQAGNYSLTAVAYDAAGMSATSSAVAIAVTTPPPPPPPTGIGFTASTDHATNVTSYLLSVYAGTADPRTATPVATSDLGKPTPAANNEITVDRATFFSALPAGSYLATVTAIGPGGTTQSSSVAFTR